MLRRPRSRRSTIWPWPYRQTLCAGASAVPEDASELARLVARTSDEAFSTAERLATLAQAPHSKRGTGYGESTLAEQLRTIAALIKSDSPARVYYTAQSGYDTHAGQANDHARLLRNLSDSLRGFVDDMAANGLAERVLVLAFSEFGRRAAENDSAGTDHGAAGPVFVAGPNLATGLWGPAPNLAELQEGDVAMAIDFRQVYATILDRWLDVRPATILGGEVRRCRCSNHDARN